MDVYFKFLGDYICYTIHTECIDKEAKQAIVINYVSQHSLCLSVSPPLFSHMGVTDSPCSILTTPTGQPRPPAFQPLLRCCIKDPDLQSIARLLFIPKG